jgi:hypothetical protein
VSFTLAPSSLLQHTLLPARPKQPTESGEWLPSHGPPSPSLPLPCAVVPYLPLSEQQASGLHNGSPHSAVSEMRLAGPTLVPCAPQCALCPLDHYLLPKINSESQLFHLLKSRDNKPKRTKLNAAEQAQTVAGVGGTTHPQMTQT